MFIINNFSTRFGQHYSNLQETKTCVTSRGVLHCFCWMWLVAKQKFIQAECLKDEIGVIQWDTRWRDEGRQKTGKRRTGGTKFKSIRVSICVFWGKVCEILFAKMFTPAWPSQIESLYILCANILHCVV